MADPPAAPPPPTPIHPDFDGHLERPLQDFTPEEKIAWIWATMQLVRASRRERELDQEP